MLPSIFQTAEDMVNDQVVFEQKETVRTYKMDLETGEIYPVMIDDKEAIAQHIVKSIKTTRDKYLIYSSNFGSEIEYILGESYSEEYFKLEFERLVDECLIDYDRVLSIQSIEFTRIEGDTVEVTINVEIDTSEIMAVEVTL